MSKPLVFVLQLASLGFLIVGAAAQPKDWTLVVAGIGIAVVSGIGIRRRFKRR